MNITTLKEYMQNNIIKNNKIKSLTNNEKLILNAACSDLSLEGCVLHEKLYLYWFGIKKPRCANPSCNNYTKFWSFNKGYSKTCSNSCAQKNPETQKKIKETNIRKYGSESYTGTDLYKNSLIKNYGASNNFSRIEIVKKIKNTFIHKYGNSNPNKCRIVREKIEKTNIKRYGTKFPTSFESEIYKEAIKKKYGVEYYQQTKDWKMKVKESWKNKSNEKRALIQKKTKSTMKKRYGVEYPLQNKILFNKALSSSNKRYSMKIYETKFGNEIKYQSNLELELLKYLEKKNIKTKNGPTLKYEHGGKTLYYHVDFETNKYLIEMKGAHKWYRDDLASGKLNDKNKVAEKYCEKNNKSYKFLLCNSNADDISRILYQTFG